MSNVHERIRWSMMLDHEFLSAEMAYVLMFVSQFVDGDAENDLGSDSGESEDEDDIADQINNASLESLSLGREVSFHMLLHSANRL